MDIPIIGWLVLKNEKSVRIFSGACMVFDFILLRTRLREGQAPCILDKIKIRL